MEELLDHTAARIALGASGIFFMTGLLTGVWKYLSIRKSHKAQAPHYVTAHRAALI